MDARCGAAAFLCVYDAGVARGRSHVERCLDWRNVVGLRHRAEAGRVAVGRELRRVARAERAACCMMSQLAQRATRSLGLGCRRQVARCSAGSGRLRRGRAVRGWPLARLPISLQSLTVPPCGLMELESYRTVKRLARDYAPESTLPLVQNWLRTAPSSSASDPVQCGGRLGKRVPAQGDPPTEQNSRGAPLRATFHLG